MAKKIKKGPPENVATDRVDPKDEIINELRQRLVSLEEKIKQQESAKIEKEIVETELKKQEPNDKGSADVHLNPGENLRPRESKHRS